MGIRLDLWLSAVEVDISTVCFAVYRPCRQCDAGCKALLLFIAANRSKSCSTLQSRMLVICAIIWRVKLCSICVRCLAKRRH